MRPNALLLAEREIHARRSGGGSSGHDRILPNDRMTAQTTRHDRHAIAASDFGIGTCG